MLMGEVFYWRLDYHPPVALNLLGGSVGWICWVDLLYSSKAIGW